MVSGNATRILVSLIYTTGQSRWWYPCRFWAPLMISCPLPFLNSTMVCSHQEWSVFMMNICCLVNQSSIPASQMLVCRLCSHLKNQKIEIDVIYISAVCSDLARILKKWVFKIGNLKILGHLFKREITIYSDNYHKHVFSYSEKV